MINNARGTVSIIIGFTMVALGILFLVDQLLPVSLWRYTWPFFVIIPGLLFFVGMVLGGPGAGWLAIPGSITTAVGLILLYQNTTGHYESWAYAWALIFPSAIGVGQVIQGTWSGQPRLITDGMRWARLGAVIFLLGGVFFEVVLDFGRGGIGRIIWPLMLIVAGAYLLFSQGGLTKMRETPQSQQLEDVPPPTGPRPGGPPEPTVPEPGQPPQPTVPRPDNPPPREPPVPGTPEQMDLDEDDDDLI